MWFAYSMAWISTGVAVLYGIHITGSAGCLWAFLIPVCISIRTSTKTDDGKEDKDAKDQKGS